jgi:hypothetical protein
VKELSGDLPRDYWQPSSSKAIRVAPRRIGSVKFNKISEFAFVLDEFYLGGVKQW